MSGHRVASAALGLLPFISQHGADDAARLILASVASSTARAQQSAESLAAHLRAQCACDRSLSLARLKAPSGDQRLTTPDGGAP